MAKFSRFDPKNKKSGRNKQQSQNKDFKIRSLEKNKSKSKLLKINYEKNMEIHE